MATTRATAEPDVPRGGLNNPWVQLCVGLVCMAMIANYQYGWTNFVDPIGARHGWGNAAIQVTFTLFVLFETWLVPFEAALVDKYGPRIMVLIGGALAGSAWILNSYATTLPMLYFGGALSGVGAGIVYGTCIGNAVKWFAGRRGLAAGLTSMGYGIATAITIIPLTLSIKNYGYEKTFLYVGAIQGIVIIIASFFLVRPPKFGSAEVKKPKVLQGIRDFNPGETLRSPVFWVMYVMFVLVASGGLMATAQLAPIAKDFFIDTYPVTLLGITLPALTFAQQLNGYMNGLTRPILGALSDRVGRETTMCAAFALEGIGIFALSKYGTTPLNFVLLSGVVFFAWGEIYSIFPSTTRDHFGQKYATTNYGMLYTAKGTASLVVPVAGIITAATGSWVMVLYIAAAANILAAIIAIVILKPLRIKEIQKDERRHPAQTVAAAAT